MPDTTNNNEPYRLIKIVVLTCYITLLAIILLILVQNSVNILISFLVVFFFFLFALGPILNIGNKTKSIRQKRTNLKQKSNDYRKSKDYFKVKLEPIQDKPKVSGKIDLNFSYKQPLIKKCDNCGFILTKYMKKCPGCGKRIKV